MSAVPIEIQVKRYICPFCHRGRSRRPAAVEHIGRCWKNPATKACRTCSNFVPDESEPEVGWNAPEYCAAGVTLPPPSHGSMVTDCEKWEARDAAS